MQQEVKLKVCMSKISVDHWNRSLTIPTSPYLISGGFVFSGLKGASGTNISLLVKDAEGPDSADICGIHPSPEKYRTIKGESSLFLILKRYNGLVIPRLRIIALRSLSLIEIPPSFVDWWRLHHLRHSLRLPSFPAILLA